MFGTKATSQKFVLKIHVRRVYKEVSKRVHVCHCENPIPEVRRKERRFCDWIKMASLSEEKIADILLHRPNLIPVLRRVQRDRARKNGSVKEDLEPLTVLTSMDDNLDEVARPLGDDVTELVVSGKTQLLLKDTSKSGRGIKNGDGESLKHLLSEDHSKGLEDIEDSQLLLKMVGEDSVADTIMDLSSTDNALHEHFQAEGETEESDLPDLQPLTYPQREARRLARQVQLEKMRISEQAEERERRYLKRRRSDSEFIAKKPKKSVKWKDEQELLSFHVYSPPPFVGGDEQVVALLQS